MAFEPNLLVLHKTLHAPGVFGCLVPAIVGLMFGCAIYFGVTEEAWNVTSAIGLVVFGGSTLLCLWAALKAALGCACLRSFRADARSRTVTCVTRDREWRQIRFEDVVAVQVTWDSISWTDTDQASRERSSVTWQINLVLHHPPLERIHVANRAGRKKTLAEGVRLAAFLGVLFVDHTD